MPAEIIDETAALPAGTQREGLGSRGGRKASPLAQAAATVMEVLLEAIDRPASEVTVLLTDDERMSGLNRQWRGKDGATDVLSFSQLEGEAIAGASDALGDIVISVDTLRRQASDGGWTEPEELARLLVHGLLHLLGHDHQRAAQARVMQAEERRLAAALAERDIGCAREEPQT